MPPGPDLRPPAEPEQLLEAARLLAGRRITALTGAGLSTDSGLPDYRGPDSPPRRPITFDQFLHSPRYRQHYWARNHLGWREVGRIEPNPGHLALAGMEKAGGVIGVITQNVDRLHQRAGSIRVVDLHGHYDRVGCLSCQWACRRAELDVMLSDLNPGFAERIGDLGDVEIAPDADAVLASTDGFRVAECPKCGGILKPDIVFFGESVPAERVQAGYDLVDQADALLVAGTSLATMSGLRFVRHAAKRDLPIVIINRGITRGDDLAQLRINAGTSQALPRLAELLDRGPTSPA